MQAERTKIDNLKNFLMKSVATSKIEKIAKNIMIADLGNNPLTTPEQTTDIIKLVSSNIAAAESPEELTPLVDGISGLLSANLTVEARSSVLDSL